MTFEPNGELVFAGGLTYFNPARWTLDVSSHELHIFLPQTPNEKLDIFHMLIGDGVKAFDRKQKAVTYMFDENTASLNIAGWTYKKPGAAAPAAAPAEPVLR